MAERIEYMKISWMGTATFALESGDERILIDPYLEMRGGEHFASFEDFLSFDTIFVTHCHFDHLLYVPEILEEGQATVFCPDRCCRTMEEYLESNDRVVLVRPGDAFPLGGLKIRVLKGRHIDFQLKHLFDTINPGRLLRYAYNLPSLIWSNHHFREEGQTMVYEISENGRKILWLGSLALDDDEQYPEDTDLLILPYQGNNDLVSCARKVLCRIKPKAVLLSHFDNAFPPLSRHMDLKPLKKLLDEEFPQIKAVRPKAFEWIEF